MNLIFVSLGMKDGKKSKWYDIYLMVLFLIWYIIINLIINVEIIYLNYMFLLFFE